MPTYEVELRHTVEIFLTDVEVFAAEKACIDKFQPSQPDYPVTPEPIDIILEAILADVVDLDYDHVFHVIDG
jgi:hypothetical protein